MPHYEIFPISADAQFPALVHAYQATTLWQNRFSLPDGLLGQTIVLFRMRIKVKSGRLWDPQ